jgi:hypothetical protein
LSPIMMLWFDFLVSTSIGKHASRPEKG